MTINRIYKSGIYAIKNKLNGKVYIGSAVNLKKRWLDHKSDLCRSAHKNDYLQKAWNKYGDINFEFSIIETIPINLLIVREQYWMDFYESHQRANGYNICAKAGSNLGLKHTEEWKKRMSEINKNFRHTEETKKRISQTKLGHIVTNEAREKMRQAKLGKSGHWLGKKRSPRSDEAKRKTSESLRRYHSERRTLA